MVSQKLANIQIKQGGIIEAKTYMSQSAVINISVLQNWLRDSDL